MSCAPNTTTRCCVRSVSLPTRSHPIVQKIDDYMNKLSIRETPSGDQTIQIGLVGLVELYKSVEDFVQLPLIQSVLVDHQDDTSVEQALDESVALLDVCDTTKDTLLTMKAAIHDLQSVFRRKRGGESSLDNKISAYLCVRKDMNKDILKCLALLKKTKVKNESSIMAENHRLGIVVRVLREVSSITISIFAHLLSFLSVKDSKSKMTGWSLVSKVMKKNKSSLVSQTEEKNKNEVESVDIALHALCRHNISTSDEAERVQIAEKRLKALEMSIKGVEDGLDCMYRRLIQTRVSLLNAINH